MSRLALAQIATLMVLGACGGSGGIADVSGSVGGSSFNEALTVLHGGPYILLLDVEVDCLEVGWVEPTYFDGDPPAEDLNYVAVQFKFDEDPQTGTFSVYGDSAVAGTGLVQNGNDFDFMHARDGTLTVDEVTEDSIVGKFDIVFDEGEASGTFETEYCRNLKD